MLAGTRHGHTVNECAMPHGGAILTDAHHALLEACAQSVPASLRHACPYLAISRGRTMNLGDWHHQACDG